MQTNYEEIDLLSLLDDLGIDYLTAGKNIGDGWVGVNPCPWCGDTRNHFAIDIDTKSINCWVCGVTGTVIKFLMKRFNMGQEQAEDLIRGQADDEYLDRDLDIEELVKKTLTKKKKKKDTEKPKSPPLWLPGERIDLKMLEERPKLSSFLRRRGIPLTLCEKFKLRYDYERSLRLIIPIKSPDGTTIAYQGRDVTGKARLPYITMPKGAPLGKTLFNIGDWKRRKLAVPVIVVEGVIDALVTISKMERHYFLKDFCVLACFRNKPTLEQARLISNAPQILSMLDQDSWWNKKAFDECCSEVKIIEAVPLPVGKDPADLTDEEFLSLNLPDYLS